MSESQEMDFNWIEVQRKLSDLLQKRDLTAALSEVEAFLLSTKNRESRSDALGFKGLLKKELGALEEAKAAYLEAHATSQPSSFMRYVHELCLGEVCEAQHAVDEALSWYKSALRTCRSGGGISGGGALQSYLRHRRDEDLTAEEHALCVAVVKQSWELLRLGGEPDLQDLAKTVSALVKAQSTPR